MAVKEGACDVRPGIWSCPPEAFYQGEGEYDCLRLMANPTYRLDEDSDCYRKREIQAQNGQSQVANTLSGILIRTNEETYVRTPPSHPGQPGGHG
ncbi:MAG: hypothetical protein GY696_00365 [Gammaproteobacteria bacterium]|nr:hypothetical protein [Gammaproteobacteria bacterium]